MGSPPEEEGEGDARDGVSRPPWLLVVVVWLGEEGVGKLEGVRTEGTGESREFVVVLIKLEFPGEPPVLTVVAFIGVAVGADPDPDPVPGPGPVPGPPPLRR